MSSLPLIKSELRLLGCRYEVEAFEEIRPDALRGTFSRWGHIEGLYIRSARCALCAGEHRTDEHKCPVEG